MSAHLGVAWIVALTVGKVLDPIGAGLDVPHRVLAEPDRVPLGDLDDLVVDLDPPGATDDVASARRAPARRPRPPLPRRVPG